MDDTSARGLSVNEQPEPEHTTDQQAALYQIVELVRFLRSDSGCPWDREQTTAEFARFAVDEATEFRDAACSDDNVHAAEECGDCLFTILAAVAAAEDEGRFSLADVIAHAKDKLIRRHAHVFTDRKAETVEEAIESWDRIKNNETAERE